MAVRLEKPWRPLTSETVSGLGAYMGVYEIGDAEGRILFIGYAGGRSLFGLRGELASALEKWGDAAAQFRLEVNQQYMTRYRELLMAHVADHGCLPPENGDGEALRLGRLSIG